MRDRASAVMKLGNMAYRAGRMEDALAKYQAALETAEELVKTDPNNVLMTSLAGVLLGDIAGVHASLRNNPAARDAFERALDHSERILRIDPNNERARDGVIVNSKNLGDLYYHNLHDSPNAQRAYQRAGDLLEARAKADP